MIAWVLAILLGIGAVAVATVLIVKLALFLCRLHPEQVEMLMAAVILLPITMAVISIIHSAIVGQ